MQPKHLRPGGFGERISPGCEERLSRGGGGEESRDSREVGVPTEGGTSCELERGPGGPKAEVSCVVWLSTRDALALRASGRSVVQRHVPA